VLQIGVMIQYLKGDERERRSLINEHGGAVARLRAVAHGDREEPARESLAPSAPATRLGRCEVPCGCSAGWDSKGQPARLAQAFTREELS